MCEICGKPRCRCLSKYAHLQVRMTDLEKIFIVATKTVRYWVDKGRLKGSRLPSGHRRVYFGDVWKFAEEHGYGKEPLAQWLVDKGHRHEPVRNA